MGLNVKLREHKWGFEGLSWKEANIGQLGSMVVVRDLWKHDMAAWEGSL